MKRSQQSKQRSLTALLGVWIGLCYVLQQCLLPLHLVLHDHAAGHAQLVFEAASVHPHGHWHHRCAHDESPDQVARDAAGVPLESQRPHPEDEQLQEKLGPAVVPFLVRTLIASTPGPEPPPFRPRLRSDALTEPALPGLGSAALVRAVAPRAPPLVG